MIFALEHMSNRDRAAAILENIERRDPLGWIPREAVNDIPLLMEIEAETYGEVGCYG